MPGSPLALLAGDALPGGLQGHPAPLQDQRAGHRCKSKPCPLLVSPVPTGRAVPAAPGCFHLLGDKSSPEFRACPISPSAPCHLEVPAVTAGGWKPSPGPSIPSIPPRVLVSPSGILILLILSPLSLSPLAQKLLGKLCEQNKVLREQERLVQQLRAEKVRGATSGGRAGTWRWHRHGEEVTCHHGEVWVEGTLKTTSIHPWAAIPGSPTWLWTLPGVWQQFGDISELGERPWRSMCVIEQPGPGGSVCSRRRAWRAP